MYVLNSENKMITQLACISPIDGRYYSKTKELRPYFSEYGFFSYRLNVEISYLYHLLLMLMSKGYIVQDNILDIKKIATEFSMEECIKIKNIEKTINHDVKAIEYYIRSKMNEFKLSQYNSFIHFGLTSQDINNTALPLTIKGAIENTYNPSIVSVINKLNKKIAKWKDVVIISKTHGQPATPTTFGKELRVYTYRLQKQLDMLNSTSYYGKIGGATGNLNAHICAYPNIDWCGFMDTFLKSFNILRNKYTTQIDNYENLSTIFDNLKRINSILIDLCQDMWLYISYEYLKLSINNNEVGSSTMPHKVNPINFENAEGNLMMANSLFEFLSRKLPVSRLQRDLTDSTVIRNIGTAFGHTLIGLANIQTGLTKITINNTAIDLDKSKHQVVLIEGIQTILRKHGYADAYEKCKRFSRKNENLNILDLEDFLLNLDVNEDIKKELESMLDINKYIGNAANCCD
jgi:adenylosuccinate lyase